MSRRVLFIVNPGAAGGLVGRRAEALLAALRSEMRADQVFTEGPRHAIALAQTASARYDVVAVVGGDGTVNEVATGLLLTGETKAVLSILPAGTGNDIAHQLGIRTWAEAAGALQGGSPRAIDAIEVRWQEAGQEVRHFAVAFAAVGFASELVKRTTPLVKRWLGRRFSYSIGFLRALWEFRAPLLRLETDHQEFRGRMFHACAGNLEYAGGGVMRLSPGARPDDGLLDICFLESLGRVETLVNFPRLLRGTHISHPKAHYFRGHTLRVESDPPVDLQLDGDLVGRTPATFQVRPAALRVLAPLTHRH